MRTPGPSADDGRKRVEPPFRDVFTPKLISALAEGYGLSRLSRDAIAGLTVAVVALPLSMAIGISSGATPAQGLLTAIVAGFVISAFGGSRFQVGGPTAAFIVVVFAVIQRHGYDGMVLATLIAAVILLALGLLRLGTYIKYIPYPVIVGFTSGIAVSIFISQVKDLLGLDVSLPADFIPKIATIVGALPHANPEALAIAVVAIAVIVGLRFWRPRWPGFLVALVLVTGAAYALHLDVATIGSAFGGVPRGLPAPSLPALDFGKVRDVFPDAITIALLAGIESLLSAVVADGMTGRRHRSNGELVAQGLANLASAFFGGLPATGAIARTATNIRAGAQTPVAGILHAVFLLLFVLVAAPVLSYVPLAGLAAILAFVAWNIAELDSIRAILTTAPVGDRVVLATTFLLTILVDLTVAIEVGVILAAFLFMHRMANAVEMATETRLIEHDVADSAPNPRQAFDGSAQRRRAVVYRINGPFFFGATQKFARVLDRIDTPPHVYILDLAAVPFVDSTALAALKSFIAKARGQRIAVVLAAASPTVRQSLLAAGIAAPDVTFSATVDEAAADA